MNSTKQHQPAGYCNCSILADKYPKEALNCEKCDEIHLIGCENLPSYIVDPEDILYTDIICEDCLFKISQKSKQK